MSPRASIAGIFLICLASCAEDKPFVTVAQEPAYYAWWLRADYHPRDNQVRGMPVKAIRNTWCKATEFRRDLFPAELLKQGVGASLDAGWFAFSLDKVFEQTGQTLTAVVGAYQSCGQKKGLFILVLDEGAKEVRFLEEFEERRAFAALRRVDGRSIELWWCDGCDNFQTLEWNGEARRFEWRFPEFGEEDEQT